MTTLTIDLADILEHKLQFGFTVPVPIDVDQLLEYADDDWREEIDLDGLLAEQRKAAVVIDAADFTREYPHLTDAQAWELAQTVRDDFQHFLKADALHDAVHFNYPTVRMTLESRMSNLRYTLRARTDEASVRLAAELEGLRRLLDRLPATDDPALEGVIAATLDDIENASREGGAA